MVTAQRRSQAQRRQSTRRRLIDAAAVVFAAKGYHDATVTDVVARAGVSTGALYTHFPGKREVFLAVFDERFVDWSASYSNTLIDANNTDNALHRAAEHYGNLLRQRPADAQLLIEFWSAAMRDESLRPAFIDRHTQIRHAMAALITATADHLGLDLSVPARELGAIVTALADGLAMQRLIEPEPAQPHDTDRLLIALQLLFAGATTILRDQRPVPATESNASS